MDAEELKQTEEIQQANLARLNDRIKSQTLERNQLD